VIKRLLLVLFLTGCSGDYIKPTEYKKSMHVTWHRLEGEKLFTKCTQLSEKFNFYYKWGGNCATWTKSKCDIYSPQIQYLNDERTKWFGHEGGHCFLGKYHQ